MKIYYAGIGSRKIPQESFNRLVEVGQFMAESGFVLRSGHAEGSDSAFEIGCDKANGEKEIFLPWKGFNGSDSKFYSISKDSNLSVDTFHPSPSHLSRGARFLMARNYYQVCGYELTSDKSSFILYWTPNNELTGGTSQALRIAKANGIPALGLDGVENPISYIKHFLTELKLI